MASENQSFTRTHPSSAPELVLQNPESLFKALKDYCKNTSAQLLFDMDPEEPETGEMNGPGKKRKLESQETGLGKETTMPLAGQDFDHGLTVHDVDMIWEADLEHWRTNRKDINEHVKTLRGSIYKESLIEDLTNQLKNGELKKFHGHAPIPKDLYELVVAYQLAWRQDYRVKNNGGRRHSLGHHPYRSGPTFSVSLVMEVANSTPIRTKTIHLPVHDIGSQESYFQFLEELKVASQSHQAEQEGFEDGYSYKQGPWMYEDSAPSEEFKFFDFAAFESMAGKDIPHLFWHACSSCSIFTC
jgi:hypothetical protein